MNKQQFIVLGAALILLSGLFFFGRTKPAKSNQAVPVASTQPADSFGIQSYIDQARKSLTGSQQARLTSLENTITRGDLKTQKILAFDQLASFWKDTARQFAPYAWYLGEKAKLENSEKSLTFAAHLYLQELRGNTDPAEKRWMAEQAKDLFTIALKINPNNDSSRIGLGSTYFFGASGDQSPMEGILRIREIAAKDSNNVFAQFMLGYGGLISGQYDRAAERFGKVVQLQPANTEAVFLLAESFEKAGKNAQAITWYEEGKKRVANPELVEAIEEKIKSLK